MKFFLLGICLLMAVNSCASRLDKHGFMFEFSDHEMLQEGITTKERVLKMMGSPTLISDLDHDEAWIYFAEDLKGFLFLKPEIVERNILVIRFESDTIRELKKISLENETKNLQFVADYTMVDSHKVGFFKSIFSNVGQIKPQ